MSEEYNPEVAAQANRQTEEDPLAELARIVSAEATPSDEPVGDPVSADPFSDAELTNGLEAELSREAGTGGQAAPAADNVTHIPAFINNINEVVDGVKGGVKKTGQNTEAGFQDDLIKALKDEVSPAASQQAVASSEVKAEQAPTTVHTAMEQTFASTQKVLAEELVAEQQAGRAVVGTVPGAQKGNEAVGQNDDLGAAFSSQFEQIIAEEAVAYREQPQAPVADQGEQAPKELADLDFGAAFAEELGVQSVTEAKGWDSNETANAEAAFAQAAEPQYSNGLDADPGHAGIIPETDHANTEFQPVLAQEKAGSRKYAVAALIIALFSGAIAAGYGFLGEGISSSGPVVIKADTDPVKIKPEDPGGRVVANQDKASYDKVEGQENAGGQQKTLISKIEEPADLRPETNDSNLQPKSDERLSSGDASGEETQQLGLAPKKVRTFAVKPDGTILQSGGEEPVNAVAASVAKPAAGTVAEIKTAESIDGAKTTGTLAAPTASPLPKPESQPLETARLAEPGTGSSPEPQAETQPAPAAPSSEWVVQVSSQRTPEAARSSFDNLRNRFSALQGRSMNIQQADVEGKGTFYRVRVQTASRDDANSLCSGLKASGGSCFVTR